VAALATVDLRLRPGADDWQEAAAALEREYPERWALPDVDDVLGELE
jgi:hypothetical protein